MTKREFSRYLLECATIVAVMLPATSGCHKEHLAGRFVVPNEALGPMTIAVAPAINLSGSADFDSNRFADLMASELTYGTGISVIPVSRVLTMLSARGLSGVESPGQALELAKLLGANAMLVFSVTEYDPYDPPSIGITAQLFGKRPGQGGGLDPIALSRSASSTEDSRRGASKRVLAQTQRVFDASHDAIVRDIRRFASLRDADDSPYGWKKYVVNQQAYVRYCCYATVRDLLNGRLDAGLANGVRD